MRKYIFAYLVYICNIILTKFERDRLGDQCHDAGTRPPPSADSNNSWVADWSPAKGRLGIPRCLKAFQFQSASFSVNRNRGHEEGIE